MITTKWCAAEISGLEAQARKLLESFAAEAAPLVQRLRTARPESGFTISMRVHWNGRDLGVLKSLIGGFAEIGVQHVMIAPEDRNVDDWDAVIDGAGKLAA